MTPKLHDPITYQAVTEKLKLNWSPQQISGALRADDGRPLVNHQTIYRHLWRLPKDHPHRRAMRRRGRRPRKAKPGVIDKALKNRVSIHQRPIAASNRKRIGDGELDLMTCQQTSGYLVTAVDRMSGYTLIGKVRSKHSGLVMNRIIKMFKDIDPSRQNVHVR